jgi:hypothetical protein
MYAGAAGGALAATAKESFDAFRILKAADPAKIAPENGAGYPQSPFGNALKQIAQLICEFTSGSWSQSSVARTTVSKWTLSVTSAII